MKYLSCIILCLGFIGLVHPLFSQKYIADYTVAKEEVLRSIPTEYIDKARRDLVIAYEHTSHGTHVAYGVFGLPEFEAGDDQLFGVSRKDEAEELHFLDDALKAYAPEGVDASDLSTEETAFIQTTRNFLDAAENATVNVVMWSWCNIEWHDVTGNYLPGMDSLISEYGPGGTKIGTGDGQREIPVSFIFMTGHPNEDDNVGPGKPRDQAALINDFCNTNGQYCIDYYSIDSHDMNDNYWEDVGDNGNSASYGGNFYEDWQNSHDLGVDYFENKYSPGGTATFGEHLSQHITANRKAYAFWWVLARISGWDGGTTSQETLPAVMLSIFPNPCSDVLFIRDIDPEIRKFSIIRSDGATLGTFQTDGSETNISIDVSNYPPGLYGISMASDDRILNYERVLVVR